MAKLRAGKTLTAADRAVLEAQQQQDGTRPRGRPRAAPAELPIYDSMEQCAAKTGIPLAIIKNSKRHGCDAFKWNRVSLGRLLPWLFQSDAKQSGINWADELKKWQAKRAQQKFERESRTLVPEDDVIRLFVDISARQKQILRQRLENEAPKAMAGVDTGSARVIAKRIVDEICREMEQAYAQWQTTHAR